MGALRDLVPVGQGATAYVAKKDTSLAAMPHQGELASSRAPGSVCVLSRTGASFEEDKTEQKVFGGTNQKRACDGDTRDAASGLGDVALDMASEASPQTDEVTALPC